MNYTVIVNEKKKEIRVMLDGYEGIARCCPTDNFNLGTGIELALERAKVAKATAEAPKKVVTVEEARKVLEDYVGDHTAIIGKGKTLSDRQKKELWDWAMTLAPEYAPKTKHCHCCDGCNDYERGYGEGYEDGLAACGDCDEDCECDCHSDEEAERLGKAIADLLTKVIYAID